MNTLEVCPGTKKKTKSSEVYRLLKKSLQYGTFAAGERLTEAKVAKEFGYGRVPVRESLLRLEAEGLLKTRGAYGGKFVEFI